MKKKCFLLSLLCLVMAIPVSAQKYLGGDISMLPKYEEKSATYFDRNGNSISDVLVYMKEQQMNAMRVRLFVDPSKASETHQKEGVCQDLAYVKTLGKRIKDAGMSFLLDFHYSDTWTDPGKHSTPDAWKSMDATALASQVYTYTKESLQALKDAGATPDFIQVGNELNLGMLWNSGKTGPWGTGTEMTNLISYVKEACKACREVCPEAKIVFHVAMNYKGDGNSQNNQYAKGWPAVLATNNVDYDIIGLSYYPTDHGPLTELASLLTYLETNFSNKKIQLVETGYNHIYYPDNPIYDYQKTYPATEEGQRKFTVDLIALLNEHANVNGLYWWWPEANEKGIPWENRVTTDWYNKGFWDNSTGKATAALYEMNRFVGGEGGGTGTLVDWILYFYSEAHGINGDVGQFKTTDTDGVYLLKNVNITAKGISFGIHNSAWSTTYGWADGGAVKTAGTAYPVASTGQANGWVELEAATYDVTFNMNDLTITFKDNSITGIRSVGQAVDGRKTVCYTLAGQRVTQPAKGLYIVNGRKVVMK